MITTQNSFFAPGKQNSPQEIISNAITEWNPRTIISLYSGGYDSAVATHVLHTLDTHGLPIRAWSVDTKLAADGWHEYVRSVAGQFGWSFDIFDNEKGFQQFVTLVVHMGCPKSRPMHTFVYQKLKERAFDALHMMYKVDRGDKTLFVSGMRRAESRARSDAAEVARVGHSNKVFAAPIVHWSQEECDIYRLENGLPDNPFYSTVKGSGDCQCNWGDFIDLETLQEHSSKLAAGNVALIDHMSKDLHGFGWDSNDVVGATSSQSDGVAALTTPFLCSSCNRSKVRSSAKDVERLLLQRGLFEL